MTVHEQPPVRIATRGSALAIAQARSVAEALPAPAELVTLTTRGDRASGPLTAVGGKGLFTAELEAALRRGQVQVAVHSAKDLPARMPADMIIAAVGPRADARDALVSLGGAGLADLPRAARVGTGSLRRACQLKALRPDMLIEGVRGNVTTRLRKLRGGQFDAIVLAMAGLGRLGLLAELAGMVRPLAPADFVPAAGQGAIAVQCLAADEPTRALLADVNHADSAAALSAERGVVRALHATCRSAVGVYVRPDANGWLAGGMVADPHATSILRFTARGEAAPAAAEALLRGLEDAGARGLLNSKGR